MTRRSLMRWMTAAWPSGWMLASRAPVPPTDQTVHYRAKATILMLSVPIFSRDHVGGGYLRVAEHEDTAGARHIELQFAAGSLPDRAAGLHRLGAFEESVLETDGQLAQATYFGFMTASNEKGLDQAKAALHSKAAGLTAIRGRIADGRVWNRLMRLSDVPQTPWLEYRSLAGELRRRFDDAPASEREVIGADGEARPLVTFLYALRCAMRATRRASEHRFVHNGEALLLRTQKRADPSGQVDQLTGHIHHSSGRLLSTFHLWFEPGTPGPLPLRFDFRARSFLRLSFERLKP